MSDLTTALRLLIVGDSASAVRAVNEVGAATAKVDGATKARNDKALAEQEAGVKKARSGMAIMAGGLGLVAGAGALAIGQYKGFAEAVINMQKVTGLSAQSSSRLVGEWQTMGMNIEGTTKIVGFFSRAYGESTKATLAQTTKAKDGIAKVNSEIAALGTSTSTAAGQKKLAAYNLELQKYNAVLDPSTQKTNAQANAFLQLGLSTSQLTAMGSDKALLTIRDRLSQMGDKAERLTIIKTIFGRGGTDPAFLRWLTASSDQMSKLDKALQSAGMIWNQQQVDQAEALGGKVRGIEEALRATAISVGSTLVPALSKVATVAMAVSGWLAKQPGWLKDIVAFSPGVLLLAIGFGKVYAGISQSIKAGQGLFNVMKSLVGKFVPGRGTSAATGASGGRATSLEDANTKATALNTSASRANTEAMTLNTEASRKNVIATDLSTGADKKNAIASDLSGTKLGSMAGKAETAAADVEGMGGKAAKAEGGLMGVNASSIKTAATLGALAIAVAFTMNQLTKLGNAIDSMNSAIGQEKKQAADVGTNAQHDLALIAKKYGKNSRQYREELGIVQSDLKAAGQDAYQEPWWAKAASGVKGGIGSAWNAVFGGSQASGGSYDVSRPTVFIAGENGPEHAIFIPHGKAGELAHAAARSGGSGGRQTKLELHLHGGTFIGTTNAAVGRDLMRVLQPLLAQRDARFVQQGAF